MFKHGDRCLLVLGEALVTLGLVLHGFQGQRVRQMNLMRRRIRKHGHL